MRTVVTMALMLTASFGGLDAATAQTRQESQKTITLYTGIVDERTASRFIDLVSNNMDQVIGLKVAVEPSHDRGSETGYFSIYHDGLLVISWDDDPKTPGGEVEVVRDGPVASSMGTWIIDDFYIVKNGGMYAGGAISIAIEEVDEAALRLNPEIKIIEQRF